MLKNYVIQQPRLDMSRFPSVETGHEVNNQKLIKVRTNNGYAYMEEREHIISKLKQLRNYVEEYDFVDIVNIYPAICMNDLAGFEMRVLCKDDTQWSHYSTGGDCWYEKAVDEFNRYFSDYMGGG